jgi:hypothetical protein
VTTVASLQGVVIMILHRKEHRSEYGSSFLLRIVLVVVLVLDKL